MRQISNDISISGDRHTPPAHAEAAESARRFCMDTERAHGAPPPVERASFLPLLFNTLAARDLSPLLEHHPPVSTPSPTPTYLRGRCGVAEAAAAPRRAGNSARCTREKLLSDGHSFLSPPDEVWCLIWLSVSTGALPCPPEDQGTLGRALFRSISRPTPASMKRGGKSPPRHRASRECHGDPGRFPSRK